MANKKTFFTTPNPYEKRFGYHRAVRKGAFIVVSGTTAVKMEGDEGADSGQQDDSKVHFPKNAKKQAKLAMNRCAEAVEKLGGEKADVVRVRMFVGVSLTGLQLTPRLSS
jgi:enamine deaminase RidA (YjgF/YER057c/UK114 family)